MSVRYAIAETHLLTFVRNAAIDLANRADDYGDYVTVEASDFWDHIRWINR